MEIISWTKWTRSLLENPVTKNEPHFFFSLHSSDQFYLIILIIRLIFIRVSRYIFSLRCISSPGFCFLWKQFLRSKWTLSINLLLSCLINLSSRPFISCNFYSPDITYLKKQSWRHIRSNTNYWLFNFMRPNLIKFFELYMQWFDPRKICQLLKLMNRSIDSLNNRNKDIVSKYRYSKIIIEMNNRMNS